MREIAYRENEYNDKVFELERKGGIQIKIMNFANKILLYLPIKKTYSKTWYVLEDNDESFIINGFNRDKSSSKELDQFSSIPVYKGTFIDLNLSNVYGIINNSNKPIKILEITNEVTKEDRKFDFLVQDELDKLKNYYTEKSLWPINVYPQYGNSAVSEFKCSHFIQYKFENWKATPKKDCIVINLDEQRCFRNKAGKQITFKNYFLIYKRTIEME
ncbi:hypothetical protein ACJA27_02925 [Mycoplasmopsis lipophila]|uniref:hypothetical protein n=1 Tax=Mycoplasmopsis lipophila TaxID=2117 RepID=UPI0038737838